MASIHKASRDKSPYWYASFLGADGTWKLKSTKSADRSFAMKCAIEWETAAKKARQGNLTAVQARKVLSELVTASTGESLSEFTVQVWINQWLESKAGSATENTLVRYKQVLRDFMTSLGSRSSAPLAGISPGDIIRYRDALRKEGRALGTCNVTLKILSVPFEAARKQGYIPNNPVSAVDALKNKRESKLGGREPFTSEELGALLTHADETWNGVILLAATTGLRLGDVAGLTWNAIDLESGLITVDTQKTGAEVTLPMHPQFFEWLAGRQRGIGKALVFPALAGMPVGGRNGLSAAFARIMKNAGIVQRAVTREGKGRTSFSKGFHSLRHTFVSALANAGVAPDIRQKLAGHSDVKTHAGYSHHEVETLRDAVAKLPRIAQ